MSVGIKVLSDLVRLRRLARHDLRVAEVVREVKREHLTYLEVQALCDLAELAIANEANGVEGIVVEAGCALGGSALVIASAKSPERPFYIFDVFGLIPPPSSKDGADVHERYRLIAAGEASGIDGQKYYGYESDLQRKVTQTFTEFELDLADHQIHLVPGRYQEVMQIETPVALAHIDCDWYDSVLTCLTQIAPNLSPGGTIVIDDYYVWSGCRKAVDDYFSGPQREPFRFVNGRRLHIIRATE